MYPKSPTAFALNASTFDHCPPRSAGTASASASSRGSLAGNARFAILAFIAFILLAIYTPRALAADVIKGSVLPNGQVLKSGEVLISPSHEFFLATQSDGNLCVYHEYDGTAVWCSRSSSAGEGFYSTGMQTDGNLCTRRSDGDVSWCLTDQARNDGPFFLALQDDANLCVYRGVSPTIGGGVWCSMALAQPKPHGPALRYGGTYHLQNGYANWSGGYLDTRGGPCNSNALCVSTATVDNRDQGSGSWVIASAEGKPNGAPVMAGEKVFLKNKYPLGPDDTPPYELFGGYLDTRGGGCMGNLLCVSASLVPNTGVNTSLWTLSSGRHSLYLGQSLRVQNQYPDPQGLAYLDTRGGGCSGNLLCVSASTSPNRDHGSGTWRFLSDARD